MLNECKLTFNNYIENKKLQAYTVRKKSSSTSTWSN